MDVDLFFAAACFQTQFDATYPIHLNGIIRQDEFVDSIENINRSMDTTKEILVLIIIFVVSLLFGLIFVSLGVALAVRLSSLTYLIMAGIAGVFFIFAFIFSIASSFILRSKRSGRLREAIRRESMKYSERSPIPCSWRLDTSSFYASAYEKRRSTEMIFYVSRHT